MIGVVVLVPFDFGEPIAWTMQDRERRLGDRVERDHWHLSVQERRGIVVADLFNVHHPGGEAERPGDPDVRVKEVLVAGTLINVSGSND